MGEELKRCFRRDQGVKTQLFSARLLFLFARQGVSYANLSIYNIYIFLLFRPKIVYFFLLPISYRCLVSYVAVACCDERNVQ